MAARRSAGRGRHRPDADQALAALYARHHRALTRLAVLLTGDLAAAERITEDAFAGMHPAWRHLHEGDRALAHLRRAVVSRARCYQACRRGSPVCRPGQPPSGRNAPAAEEMQLVALHALPRREREALILRCYAGLPDAQLARATATSARSARARIRRGLAALQAALDVHEAGRRA